MDNQDIFAWVKSQESDFETQEIKVADNWNWSFRKHVQLIFHLKNGVFFTGANDWLRAFKNIMEPILNLSYWSEDIEVKDVLFYIEEENGHVLSLLVKKYHDEVFVRKYNLDTLFDEITESDLDYGGALVQKTNEPRPEVFQLNDIAFCDQTDIFGGPIGFKHEFSPDKLRSMAKFGWGDAKNGADMSLNELITLAQAEKTAPALGGQKNQVTGKTIEVYIIRGNMPDDYLKDNDNYEDYYNQVQIIAFYTNKDHEKEGVRIYRKKEDEGNFKFHTSKKVNKRALGRGVGESLLHPQIWSNYLEIHKMNMLAAGSKVPLVTDDPEYTQKNKIQDMETLEITTIADGKTIKQIPTIAPANVELFDKAINEWYEQGQLQGSAFDPQLGKQPNSGTTFRGQDQVVQQGQGIHERRRGQRAKFIEEIYRDWILPEMVKEILQGHTFLAELSVDESSWIFDQLSTNYANREMTQDVLNGKTPRDPQQLKQECLKSFQRGNKHLFEILKDEFKDVDIRMGINIAGKQRDLANRVEKLRGVFTQILANPYMLKAQPIAKLFNQIIEASGLDPVDLSNFDVPPMPTRRMTETLDYADLPPAAQQEMLKVAGINVQNDVPPIAGPVPSQPTLPATTMTR